MQPSQTPSVQHNVWAGVGVHSASEGSHGASVQPGFYSSDGNSATPTAPSFTQVMSTSTSPLSAPFTSPWTGLGGIPMTATTSSAGTADAVTTKDSGVYPMNVGETGYEDDIDEYVEQSRITFQRTIQQLQENFDRAVADHIKFKKKYAEKCAWIEKVKREILEMKREIYTSNSAMHGHGAHATGMESGVEV
ncbi:hypothetical protein HGRIS_000540 [Hohenbuehelia grisea]|uniref:Uncharacterized protein n=1 Tax=Hohenbuehelia grisea TaxID=104357 RepID=A0ABR3JRB0_9AGAR